MTTFASDGSTIEPAKQPALAPVVEPEVVEPETLPAVQAAAPVAVVEDTWTHPDDWGHDWLEFKGDKLGVRVPAPQAMSALSIGLGKFVPPKVQNDLTGLFIARHLSEASYERVYSRLMEPDDTDYDASSIGELMGALMNTGVEQFEKATAVAEAGPAK